MHRAIAFVLALVAAAPSTGVAYGEQNASMRHPASMADLLRLRELGGLLNENVTVSPSGDAVAFFERETDLTRNRYIHRLLVVDVATGAHRVIAEAGDIILGSIRGRHSGAPFDRRPVWSPDGAWIYYQAERDGVVEIRRARTDGSANERVLRPAGDVRRMASASNGVIVFETLTPRTDLAAQRAREERDGFLVDEAFTPLYSRLPLPDEDGGAQVLSLDAATGLTRPATDAERAAFEPAAAPVAIRPLDPTSTAQAPPLGVFFSWSGSNIICPAAECSGALKDAWVFGEEDAPTVLFRRLEGHARFFTALYAWRPGEPHVRFIRRDMDRLQGCVAAGGTLVCLQDFATQPRRLVRINLACGGMDVLYDPNTQWRSVRLPRIERLEHADGEGNQSFAQLVYPLNYRRGRSYPLVIVQYRARGFLNAGTGGETPIFPLSGRGYFVLCFDRPEFDERATRLSMLDLLRETEFDGSENRIKREAILAFIEMLQRRGVINSDRMAITGMSDGAETAFDMAIETDLFRAVVVGSPPTGPLSYALQSRRFHAQRLEQLGLTPPWDETSPTFGFWRENSAELRADRIQAALMINAPESEMLSGFALLARLEQTTTPVETYIYPGAYHLKWRPSQIWAAQERSIAWLDFWLRDVEPADQSQRERWVAMRERARQARLASSALGSEPTP